MPSEGFEDLPWPIASRLARRLADRAVGEPQLRQDLAGVEAEVLRNIRAFLRRRILRRRGGEGGEREERRARGAQQGCRGSHESSLAEAIVRRPSVVRRRLS